MSLLGVVDLLVLAPVAALAIAAIVWPAKRWLRGASVIALVTVAIGYTTFRPGARAALAYYERSGGTWSKEWLAGVESVLVVTRHFPSVVLTATVLLALIALRSK